MTQKALMQSCVRNKPVHQMTESKACMRKNSGKGLRMIDFAMTARVVDSSTLFRIKSILIKRGDDQTFYVLDRSYHNRFSSYHRHFWC